jgi:N-acetyltransferase
MSFRLEGPVLEGTLIRLEPLAHRHAADLAVAAEQDRSSHGFTWVPERQRLTSTLTRS